MKKQGRPLKFGQRTIPLMMRMPASEFDRLCREAGGRNELVNYVRNQVVLPEFRIQK